MLLTPLSNVDVSLIWWARYPLRGLVKGKDLQNCIESVLVSSAVDPKLKQAIEESKAADDGFNRYLRFYASRIVKKKSNLQN